MISLDINFLADRENKQGKQDNVWKSLIGGVKKVQNLFTNSEESQEKGYVSTTKQHLVQDASAFVTHAWGAMRRATQFIPKSGVLWPDERGTLADENIKVISDQANLRDTNSHPSYNIESLWYVKDYIEESLRQLNKDNNIVKKGIQTAMINARLWRSWDVLRLQLHQEGLCTGDAYDIVKVFINKVDEYTGIDDEERKNRQLLNIWNSISTPALLLNNGTNLTNHDIIRPSLSGQKLLREESLRTLQLGFTVVTGAFGGGMASAVGNTVFAVSQTTNTVNGISIETNEGVEGKLTTLLQVLKSQHAQETISEIRYNSLQLVESDIHRLISIDRNPDLRKQCINILAVIESLREKSIDKTINDSPFTTDLFESGENKSILDTIQSGGKFFYQGIMDRKSLSEEQKIVFDSAVKQFALRAVALTGASVLGGNLGEFITEKVPQGINELFNGVFERLHQDINVSEYSTFGRHIANAVELTPEIDEDAKTVLTNWMNEQLGNRNPAQLGEFVKNVNESGLFEGMTGEELLHLKPEQILFLADQLSEEGGAQFIQSFINPDIFEDVVRLIDSDIVISDYVIDQAKKGDAKAQLLAYGIVGGYLGATTLGSAGLAALSYQNLLRYDNSELLAMFDWARRNTKKLKEVWVQIQLQKSSSPDTQTQPSIPQSVVDNTTEVESIDEVPEEGATYRPVEKVPVIEEQLRNKKNELYGRLKLTMLKLKQSIKEIFEGKELIDLILRDNRFTNLFSSDEIKILEDIKKRKLLYTFDDDTDKFNEILRSLTAIITTITSIKQFLHEKEKNNAEHIYKQNFSDKFSTESDLDKKHTLDRFFKNNKIRLKQTITSNESGKVDEYTVRQYLITHIFTEAVLSQNNWSIDKITTLATVITRYINEAPDDFSYIQNFSDISEVDLTTLAKMSAYMIGKVKKQ